MKILFLYPNLRGMNMLPPAVAILSRLLKDENHDVDLFDTTYYKDAEILDDESAKHSALINKKNQTYRCCLMI